MAQSDIREQAWSSEAEMSLEVKLFDGSAVSRDAPCAKWAGADELPSPSALKRASIIHHEP